MYYTSKEVYEFISKQTNDPIVQWKQCKISGSDFPIYQSDLDFYDKISPKFSTDKEIGDKLISQKPDFFSRDKNGKLKVKVPTPTLCPEERQRRRLLFRNERKLYKRKCDATGENIISIYSPDKDLKVYKQDFWWSDKWDPMDYGIEIGKGIPHILSQTPVFSLYVTGSENCDYNNALVGSKNCYLSSGSRNDSCLFSQYTNDSKKSIDGFMVFSSEECYNCSDIVNCSYCFSSQRCELSNNLINCIDCVGCSYCIDSNNLIQKKYHINNKQYSKEAYLKYLSTYKFTEKKQTLLYTSTLYQKSSVSSISSNISGSKNLIGSFDCHNSENIKYSTWFNDSSDCMDNHSRGKNATLCYENAGVGINSFKNISNFWCENGTNIYNSIFCFNSSDLFGCVGLRNKQYCIFNKQYTKEEYNNLVPQIINKMIDEGTRGEFFDPSLSPFGYNETVAQEYFPLTREEALARGYKRQDNNYDPVIPTGVETLKGDQIPSDISTVTDDILKRILVCEVSGRPFRIVKQELEFYRKHNIPLPRKHPDVRHQERLKQRPHRELHLRNCDKCGKEMVSVYDKSFEGKVYCEECYQKEIYG